MTGATGWLTELPDLPFDRRPGLHPAGNRHRRQRVLPCGSSSLADLAAGLDMPVDQVVLTAWAVVLAVYSQRSNLRIGVAEGGTLIGLDVNIEPTDPFADVARRMSDLFATVAGPSQQGPAVFDLDGEPTGAHRPVSNTSFVVGFHCRDDTASLIGHYDPDAFDGSTVDRILDHLSTVISIVTASGGDMQIGDIDIVTATERSRIASWNSTSCSFVGGHTLVALFGDGHRAALRESAAIDMSGHLVSHRQFARLVGRVTGELLARGVGRDALVGVMGERSVALVAAVHGVVQAGAAYVPLDHEQPTARIEHMVRETAMTVVLCEGRSRERFAGCDVAVVDLDELLKGADEGDCAHLAPPEIAPDDVAYVIYTSGSTGHPKGVVNTHRGVVNRLQWMQARFPLSSADVVLHKTPFTFDVSVWELFWPLQAGARLVVAEPGGHRDPSYLVETIVRCGVTTIHFVPSMLRLFLEHPAAGSCGSLRRVICSGEALTRDLQNRFFEVLPDVELHNLYGPTEAAIDVTAWQCHVDDNLPVVPIGAPIANTTIHVLDHRMRVVPIGIAGELYIGGVQVAAGYVNRADLTAERFIADPFDPPGRLYRTGDLARWLPGGQLDFLGRSDTQVKVRGQRVELGEIESVLEEHPAVLAAAVTVIDLGGEARLVAHLSWAGDRAPDAALSAFLATRLPSHMIPLRFVSHDALPLTSSGKVDRKALAAIAPASHRAPATPAGENPLERFLIELWCSLLERPDIGRDDRVFDLGASSLQAAAFVNAMQRELGEFIYVVTAFLAPTVAEYAALLVREYPAAVARRFGAQSADQRAPLTRVDEGSLRAMQGIVPRFAPHPSWRRGERNEPAVFILAPPRSGTTLLRVMLAGHPGLFAAPELQLLGFDNLAQRRRALVGRFSPWREGTIRAVMELQACDAATAAALMQSQEQDGVSSKDFYRWLQDRAGDRMLVDKSPAYALDPDALRNAEHGFDSPRYIHLVRDPFAMSRSFESYHMDQILFLDDHEWPGRILGELVWTLSHRNILAFAAEVPADRVLRVHFEDLVRDPRPVMTTVASFLGLEFDEGLVEPYERLDTKMVDGLHAESTPMGDTRLLERNKIDPDVVRRWTKSGSESELGEPTLRLARRLGYGSSPQTPDTRGGRRRFADATRQRRAARSSDG